MATLAGSPTAATENTATGTVDWENLANVGSSNNEYANTEPTPSAPVLTHPMELAYVASFDAIPTGSVIDGITVNVENHKNDNRPARIISAQLMKSGTPAGDVKTNATDPGVGPGNDGVTSFGGAADLWGTTWSLAQVKTGFGVRLIGEVTVGPDSDKKTVLRIDDVPVTITYTPTTTTTTTPAP